MFEPIDIGHNGYNHYGTARSCTVPFIDQSEYLSSLINDPQIGGIFASLLGNDYNYLGSTVIINSYHSSLEWSHSKPRSVRLEGGNCGFPPHQHLS